MFTMMILIQSFVCSQIVEKQTEVYFKTDPDPFDDRHPGRADPNCTLGHVLKIILKNDDLIQAVSDVVYYMLNAKVVGGYFSGRKQGFDGFSRCVYCTEFLLYITIQDSGNMHDCYLAEIETF